jgi:hypothetical protein
MTFSAKTNFFLKGYFSNFSMFLQGLERISSIIVTAELVPILEAPALINFKTSLNVLMPPAALMPNLPFVASFIIATSFKCAPEGAKPVEVFTNSASYALLQE